MRLHEAIEKAGEYGKIRREQWDGDLNPVDIYRGAGTTLTRGTNNWIPLKADLTATDWRVLKDEVIKVGDVVEGEKCNGEECEVMKTQKNSHGNTVFALLNLGEYICQCEVIRRLQADLTLIRKGNVHVFEGVEIVERKGHVYTVLKGSQIHPAGYYDLRNDGKTYDITLKERPDV